MTQLAQRLGQGTDFVRVDLYDLPGRIVFGPESFNLEFGSHWTPPRRYR